MKVNGWELPDGEHHFIQYAEKDGYQFKMIEIALGYVRNWRTAVDVGAHVGFHAKKFAALFGDVWAFEPIPSNYRCLIHNAPEVKAVMTALGDDRGDLSLSLVAPDNSGSWEKGEGTTVPVMRLDDYPLENVDLLKIDVQGMELEVLKGAEATVKRWKPLVIVEDTIRGETNADVLPLLVSWGMTPFARVNKDLIAGWR